MYAASLPPLRSATPTVPAQAPVINHLQEALKLRLSFALTGAHSSRQLKTQTL